MKPAIWYGDSLARVRNLPPGARREVGFQLRLVQGGDEPTDWKPIPSIGPGVCEIRVRLEGAFRLIYIAKFAEAIYVLHVFQKKSRKTSLLDLRLATQRYGNLLRERRAV